MTLKEEMNEQAALITTGLMFDLIMMRVLFYFSLVMVFIGFILGFYSLFVYGNFLKFFIGIVSGFIMLFVADQALDASDYYKEVLSK